MSFYPNVIEKTGRGSKTYDLATKLFEDRTVFLSGPVNDASADSVIMQLLWLKASNPNEDVNLYIKSPGGSVIDGQAIKNTIDNLNKVGCKVNTIGIGQCCSMGAYLLASGTGTRTALPDCRIMIHSVLGGFEGSYHDMKPNYQEIEYLQNKVIEQMAGFTKGKTSLEEMKKLCERDNYMSPEEALKLGLIDVLG